MREQEAGRRCHVPPMPRYNTDMQIRPATVRDVPGIADLIATFAQRGKMLFRSHAQLYEAVRDFHVAEKEGRIVGIVALEIVWADLAEVRSLAVHAEGQGQGVGKALVRAVIDEARRLEIQRV